MRRVLEVVLQGDQRDVEGVAQRALRLQPRERAADDRDGRLAQQRVLLADLPPHAATWQAEEAEHVVGEHEERPEEELAAADDEEALDHRLVASRAGGTTATPHGA